MSKHVLLTGGAGFVGHHLLHHILSKTDYTVAVLDRLDLSGSLSRIADVLSENPEWEKRVTMVWHDLKAPLNTLVKTELGKVNYVLHVAAGSHVDRSIDYPLEFVMDNVVGTCNLLDYARNLDSLEKFLYFSTDEVFGPAPDTVRYVEWARYNSGNPYAATKAGAEELCLAFANTYSMPVFVTHTMNIFGIRQHPEKFIPMVVGRTLRGEKVYIHSNADCTEAGKRYYINTEDVANGILFLLDNAEMGDKYNLVGERELDNLQLAQMIASHVGKPLNYEMVDFHSSRPGHDLRYALNGDKMAKMGWAPEKPVDERLKEVVEWSLAHPNWIINHE
jgi:dTDP-glucose 4,6-dehydratase